ncbi:hypothetical protein [Buttiauxella sp.]|uniref:hypothetical protein n=1 Tax=Buttiauxella sp. TaxID=1972222 RepID=UPI003C786B71
MTLRLSDLRNQKLSGGQAQRHPTDEIKNSRADKRKRHPTDEIKNSRADKHKRHPTDEIKNCRADKRSVIRRFTLLL